MQKNSFELSVLVHGKPLREYLHKGKIYIEGRANSKYELLLRNNSARRVEAVISVDGLDVLDGKPAKSTNTGYVIQPWQTLRLEGWRLTDEEVAAFLFAEEEESYASKKGKKRNMGVIGVAFYFERVYQYNYGQYNNYGAVKIMPLGLTGNLGHVIGTSYNSADLKGSSVNLSNHVDSSNSSGSGILRGMTTCSVSSAGNNSVNVSAKSSSLGTGFGERTESKVYNTSFTRDTEQPTEILEMRYNNRDNLEKLGIKIAQPLPDDLQARETAKPFEDIGSGCTPPEGWNG